MSDPKHYDGEGEQDVHDLHDPIVREMERPRDGYQPIPLTLVFLFFALIGWGGWYLGTNSGDWRVDVMYPGDRPAATEESNENGSEKLTEEELVSTGEQVYSRCSSCHRDDGAGVPGSFPPLDGSKWVTGDPELPVRILLHGLTGPVKVAGESYSGKMPAWGDQLTDRQIAGVVSYIRSNWSNRADSIDPSFVEQVREETSDRADPWTASDLGDLTP